MLDIQTLFEPLAGTALTVSTTSTYILDAGIKRDVGVGWEAELHVSVKNAFTAGGAATLQIGLQVSADNATYYDVLFSPVYAVAALTAGKGLFRYNLPPLSQLNYAGAIPAPRYMQLSYTIATGPMTGGSLIAYLNGHFDRDSFIAYPKNYVD